MYNIEELITELTVDYKNETVLLTDSTELELVNEFFNSITCGNKELENLLYEIIGYSLLKSAIFQKAFIFKGNGRNGKSSIVRIIEAILGIENCSYEHIEDISGTKLGSKNTVFNLKNRTVNIAEDQTQPKFINSSILNRIIAGDTISIMKGKERVVFRPYATLIFLVNDIIDFKKTKIFITDRFIVIPFKATFIENRDIFIESKLTQPRCLEIIATKAIKAIKEVFKNEHFTIPDVVEEETKRYFMECNNVLEFCSLYPIKNFIIKRTYYREYCKWCNSNNLEAYNDVRFGKEVLNLGYRSERITFDKRTTCYVSSDFDKSKSSEIYNEYLSKNGLDIKTAKMYDEETLVQTFGIEKFSDYLCESLYE